MSLKDVKNEYQRKLGEKSRIEKQISQSQEELKNLNKRIKVAEKAKDIIRQVAQETQELLQYKLTNTVSTALESVFDDPYEFQASFEQRRGKTECDLSFVREGQSIPPLEASGYGAVDIASFALRAACWSMFRQTRPVLVLDEPMKHLKGAEENRRAIAMMQEISKELGIQMIIVSDERAPLEDIQEESDKVFKVAIKGGLSQIKEV